MSKITIGILTASDKGSRGEREDKSHDAIVETLSALDAEVVWYQIVPDEKDIITEKLIFLADKKQVDLVLTTGGTGLSPRDVTPEATVAVIEKAVPGIAEAMRAESLKKTPAGMLSRSVAGIRKRTLIINLPGSPKGAQECLEAVLSALPHAIEVMRGEVGDHIRPELKTRTTGQPDNQTTSNPESRTTRQPDNQQKIKTKTKKCVFVVFSL